MDKRTQTTMRLKQDTLAKLKTLKAEQGLSMAKILAILVDKYWKETR
tara:strand:+ start:458 stop:598 length:141 start_codon:yes stop_codon:yes gene_type:complete